MTFYDGLWKNSILKVLPEKWQNFGNKTTGPPYTSIVFVVVDDDITTIHLDLKTGILLSNLSGSTSSS